MSDNPFDALADAELGAQSKKPGIPTWLIISVVILLAVVAAYFSMSNKTNTQEKSQTTSQKQNSPSTASNQSTVSTVSEKVSSMLPGSKKVYNVCLDSWGGYVGGMYFNRGFEPNIDSEYTKKYGINVRFVSIEKKSETRDAWKAGKCDMVWGTLDSFASEAIKFKSEGHHPEYLFNVDRSNGGDAVIARRGINSIPDLKGKKVALLPNSPSHTLFLKALLSAGMAPSDVTIVKVESGEDAAKLFTSGEVDAAVAWSPDYEEAVKGSPGAKVLFSTKEATHVVFDGFFAQKDHYAKNKEAIDNIARGWLDANAEINTSPDAKQTAAKIFAKKYNYTLDQALYSISLARLYTTGDNRRFFGIDTGAKINAGEVFTETAKMYQKFGYTDIIPSMPAWREFFNPSLVESLKVKGPSDEAEGEIVVNISNAATKTAVSTKGLAITFPSGSYKLDENAKGLISDEYRSIALSNQGFAIRVEGNTDNVGDKGSNKLLSLKRAQAAADYLQSIGVNKANLVVVGYGSENPVPSCDTHAKECRGENRRTQFSLIK